MAVINFRTIGHFETFTGNLSKRVASPSFSEIV
jgi:hypothetical protein